MLQTSRFSFHCFINTTRSLLELKRKAADYDALSPSAKRARTLSNMSKNFSPPICWLSSSVSVSMTNTWKAARESQGNPVTNPEPQNQDATISPNTSLSNPLASKHSSYITDSRGQRREFSPTLMDTVLTAVRVSWSFVNMGIQPTIDVYDRKLHRCSRAARSPVEY